MPHYAAQASKWPAQFHCHDSIFTSELNGCLGCAQIYGIWKEYGDYVVAAASACGDNATPSPSLTPAIEISTGSAAASTTVIATALSTVSPTTT
ncbi:hypothetical protein DPV78_003735 [Talaromyces pinophilus]|nr:hypothetical protein DPV78_003735 [Talaromyces pinophilus]